MKEPVACLGLVYIILSVSAILPSYGGTLACLALPWSRTPLIIKSNLPFHGGTCGLSCLALLQIIAREGGLDSAKWLVALRGQTHASKHVAPNHRVLMYVAVPRGQQVSVGALIPFLWMHSCSVQQETSGAEGKDDDLWSGCKVYLQTCNPAFRMFSLRTDNVVV